MARVWVKMITIPAALACLLVACGGESAASQAERAKPLVCTTLYPLQYMARRIAGDLARVECVVPAPADPLHWTPGAGVIAHMQGADLIVLNGAHAEPWLDHVSLPLSRLVDTSKSFADRFIELEAVTHSHGSGAPHTHSGIDPHTWMDPENAKAQARTLLTALQQLLPDHRDALANRGASLIADLDALAGRFAALTLPAGETLVASHPAYNYLAARNGWRIESLDLDPAAKPTAAALATVRAALKGLTARLILWESPPSAEWIEALQGDPGLASVVFRPAETPPLGDAPDYLAEMAANASRLAEAWPGAR